MEEKLIPQGFVLIHRALMEKGYYQDSQYIHLWVHLILKANHKMKKIMWNGKETEVKRGQFITGRRILSKETGINEYKIERILTFFEDDAQQIAQQKTPRFRLISILNYDKHQTFAQQTAQQLHNDCTQTKNEEELIRSLKTHVLTSKTQLNQWLKLENRCLTSGWLWHQEYETFQLAIDLDDAYEAWWMTYARHTGKRDAKDYFRTRCKEGRFDEICQGTYGYNQYIKQQLVHRGVSFPEYEEFIKHPKTFLQKDRWKEKIGYKYRPKL